MLNPPIQDLLQKELSRKDFLRISALAVLSIFGVGGVIMEAFTHAASPYVAGDATDGTLAGTTSDVGDAVQFGAGPTMAAVVLPGAPTHETLPTRISWGNFPGGGPSGYVFVTSAKYMNIFPVGAAISLKLTSSIATNWNCRDIYGNSSSGLLSGTTLVPTPPAGGTAWPCGWYRLAFIKSGANVSGGWGDQCGDGTFFVMNDNVAALPGPSQFPNGVAYSDASYGTWVPPLATACGTIPSRWSIADTASPTTGNTDSDPYDGSTTESMVEILTYDANWFLKYGTANRPHQDFISFENGTVDVVNVTANSVETILGAGAPFTMLTKTATQVYVSSTTAGTVQIATTSGGSAVETWTGSTWGAMVSAINKGSAYVVAYSSSSGTKAATFAQATIVNSGFVGIASVVSAVAAQAAKLGVTCPAFDGPYNEPDNDPVLCAAQMVAFKAAVNSAHAGATVLGPMAVTINGAMTSWISQFFAACKAIGYEPNALSFHGYNVVNGDMVLADHSFSVFNAALASAGYANVPIWMTEGCGEFVNNYGAISWRNITHWYALRMLLYEVHGVPLERQAQYYMSFMGYDFPSWLKSGGYQEGPVAAPVFAMWRGFSEHTANAASPTRLTFPGAAANLFFGSLYTSPANQVIVLVMAGSPSGSVELSFNSSVSATVYDWAGNSVSTTTVNSLQIEVSDLPTYVVIATGITLTITDANSGLGALTTNLALNATVHSSSTVAAVSQINNGKFEDGFYYGGGSPNGLVPFSDNVTPTSWFVLEWSGVQTVSRVLLFSAPGWQSENTPTAFTVYTWNGTAWAEQYSYTNTTAVSETFMTNNNTWQSFTETFWDGAHNFDVRLSAAVQTTAVRVDITQTSYGSDPDNAAGSPNSGSGPAVCLREIQVF